MIHQARGPSGDLLVKAGPALLATLLMGFATSPAQAQWYPGTFWGNPFLPGPSSVDVINQAALNRIASVQQSAPAYRSPQPERSMRDPEFFERYDVETRRAMEDRVARRPSRAPAPAKTSKTTATAPIAPLLPIANFFNRANQLVWPSDAPVQGELGPKRANTDAACLLVKERIDQKAAVPVALVTDARAKLLEYGRPALDYLRKSSTPPISETFHMFLLSLYESLAQTAKPAAPAR